MFVEIFYTVFTVVEEYRIIALENQFRDHTNYCKHISKLFTNTVTYSVVCSDEFRISLSPTRYHSIKPTGLVSEELPDWSEPCLTGRLRGRTQTTNPMSETGC